MNDFFDEEGYPTAEALYKIRKWNYTDIKGCFEFMRQLWFYDDYWREEKVSEDSYTGMQYDTPRQRYYISTAGWSGNEDIIRALKENQLLWSLTWVQSRRGGHYIFEVKE